MIASSGAPSESTLPPRIWAGLVAAAAALTYWPGFWLPLISDDYLVIDLARRYAEQRGGWEALLGDALYRTRALFMGLSYLLYQAGGLAKWPYSAVPLALHVVNCLLAYRLLLRWGPPPIAGLTALIFAVHHGHQEAIWWYSALPDAMVLTSALMTVGAWLEWLETSSWRWYGAALVAFLTGLASKESAATIPGLLAGVALVRRYPPARAALALAPYAALSAAYFAASFTARETHQHYQDGTFSLGWHFFPVMARSITRMLWPWGLVASVLLLGQRRFHRLLGLAWGWMAITLLAYCFLTYMPFVPSRHTYPASLAMAAILAAGLAAARQRWHWSGRRVGALVTVFIALEWGYLWTRKYAQYQQRARPTEELKAVLCAGGAPARTGVVELRCFAYPPNMVQSLLRLETGDRVRLLLAPEFRETFDCRVAETARFLAD